MPVMERKSAKGFTLLELIITVAIAGILLGIGVPGFGSLMRESRISSQYNSLVGSLYQARSEAIKGASDVTVCPKRGSGDNRCGGNNDWENGWIVFLDRTNAPGEVNADISAGDEIISVKPEIKGNNTITAIGSSTNAVGNVQTVSYVRYLQNGATSLSTGSIIICDDTRGAADSRALNIVQTGDIRRGAITPANPAPLDAFNRPIVCP